MDNHAVQQAITTPRRVAEIRRADARLRADQRFWDEMAVADLPQGEWAWPVPE